MSDVIIMTILSMNFQNLHEERTLNRSEEERNWSSLVFVVLLSSTMETSSFFQLRVCGCRCEILSHDNDDDM